LDNELKRRLESNCRKVTKAAKRERENQMQGCNGTRVSLAILLTVVACAALAAAQAPAYTATLQNQVTTNSCSAGEPVALSGTVSYQVSVSTDPTTGANTFTITASSNLNGVGQTTGTSYLASDSSDYIVSSTQPSSEAVVEFKSDLTSQGSAPSMTVVQTLDIVVDASGNISAQVTGNTTQCGN
jgi:hypothetical protein